MKYETINYIKDVLKKKLREIGVIIEDDVFNKMFNEFIKEIEERIEYDYYTYIQREKLRQYEDKWKVKRR